jgi:hypothetical protein
MTGAVVFAALLAPVAEAGSFEPVVTDLGGGARIDWTSMQVLVEATRTRSGSEGTRAVEELARREVDAGIGPAADQIRLAPGDRFEDLKDSPELWPALQPRVGRWIETENRYHSSGRVTVIGALDLVELLKPVAMATATSRTGPRGDYTGLVLDARGVEGVEPCVAPELVAGVEILYDGRLWLEAAVERAPSVWVSDAADPAADRAGDAPLLVRVETASGCRLTVPAGQVDAVRTLAETAVLGDGTLVIVVEPQ